MTSRYAAPELRELIQCRETKGITLQQIAETTKIGLRYLVAIECGDFQKLPGGVYTLSYLKQYARAVEDCDNILLNYYHTLSIVDEPKPVAPPVDRSWVWRLQLRIRSIWNRKECTCP